jgi:hypothetical protein
LLVLAAAFLVVGCGTVGTQSIERDRLGYVNALGESWKEQTLLNIVKLRYMDTPVFLDVSSLISSYEVARQLSLTANVFPNASVGNNQGLGASGTFTDKPTISYTPITGERYMNSLIRPIPPQAIFAMIEAGHPADFLLRATVRAINGVYNYSVSQDRARPEDPRFSEILRAMRAIQQAGALSVRVQKDEHRESTFVGLHFGVSKDADESIRFLKDTLGISPDKDEPLLVFGALRRDSGQIAVLTRSVQEILTELSSGVEVPPSDAAEGRAVPMLLPRNPAPGAARYPPMRVKSADERPSDAFAAVQYRGRWFWIDDRDLESKRMIMFLTVFSSLAETGTAPQVPLITIPAR